MTEPQPRNDFSSFPAPAEGILVAMFITVRKVARSRDFYSRLGGTSSWRRTRALSGCSSRGSS